MRIERVDLIQFKMPKIGHFENSYGSHYSRNIVDPEFLLNSDGTISVPQGTGLGVAVNPKILDSYTKAREVIRI